MIRTFSHKLLPPFSGQVQIAESDVYRALTLDGNTWDIQYVRRSHVRICTLSAKEIKSRSIDSANLIEEIADPELVELLDFLADIKLPFSVTDHFEYWLLDKDENQPLALLYSCSEPEQKSRFPNRAEWTALPDAVLSVEKTDEEVAQKLPPVNYRVERMVAERAGLNSNASWFDTRDHVSGYFPPFLLREDWADAEQQLLVKRYIDRQAPRLLMLHGLSQQHRQRLESCCKPFAVEVARFCAAYPEVLDEELIRTLRVEARLREVAGDNKQPMMHAR